LTGGPDDRHGLLYLRWATGRSDLAGGRMQLLHLGPQLLMPRPGTRVGSQVPHPAQVGLGPARLRQREDPAATLIAAFGQALILEQLQ